MFWIIISLLHTNVYAGCDTDKIRELGDLSLRLSTNVWDSTKSKYPPISDHGLSDGWYSSVYNGWQYVMTHSKTVLEYAKCNTYEPIYLPALHPPLKDITENPITVTACISDEESPCSNSYNIQIRNCNGVIQYYLKLTKRYAGYCFDKYSKVKDENTVLPAPTDVNLGEISVVPQLKFTKPSNSYLPWLVFKCKFTSDYRYFYTVYWYIGKSLALQEVALPPKGPSQSIDDLELNETEIMNKSLGLGIEMKCGVTVSQAKDGLKTETVLSSIFFAGVKTNTTIYLDKNSKATIQLKLTVPIGCRYQPGREGVCDEYLTMSQPLATTCSANVAEARRADNVFQRCGIKLKYLSITDSWDPSTVYTFDVVTIDQNYDDKTSFHLQLKLSETLYHKIWKGYELPSIKVIVRNTESYKNKVCYCHIDPHMKTADQTNGYELQSHYGTYLMYRNKEYHIQVQIKTVPCWDQKQPTCACAVAVSAGRDVFMINMCGTQKYFGFTHCDDNGILEVVRVHERQYKIFTPIGTMITVSINGWGKDFLNIDIVMAPKDVGQTEGLCGYFDGKPDNDFVHSDGKTFPYNVYPDDFTRSWQFDKGLKNEDSLFQAKPKLRAWKDDNSYYCVCENTESEEKKEALCRPSQYFCEIPGSVTKSHCTITTNRKRRSLGASYDIELERLMKLMEPVPSRVIAKREVSQQYTEKEARRICTNKINGSLAVTKYREFGANSDPNVVIEECVYDVTIGEDIKLADVHLEAVNTFVKSMMDKQPVYVANNTEKVEVFLENTCPGNCSGIGTCTKTGVCVCIDFYHGSDCSIDERDPLIIDDIEGGGLCDVAYGDECSGFVLRSDNILKNYSCSVKTFKISVDGKETYVSSNLSSGQFLDVFTGFCYIPNNILGSQDLFVAKYNISISNNGINFGNEATMYVHDSRCQDMSLESDNTRQFTLKENRCFIDGVCFDDDDMAPAGCLACHSDLSSVSWTEYNPCRNGGKCRGEEFGYGCSCVAGYRGINCEIDIDECASVRCQNGGKCIDLINGYNCSCVSGYDGLLCEIDVNECMSNPCQNGATCHDAVNGYTCRCLQGFKGIHCEIDIDECLSNPCKNSTVCVDLVNGYRCQCRQGFQGIKCDIDIDECASNPCMNGGSCTDMINGYNCSCKDGFKDKNCETDIDECASNPCMNGGSCTDMINGYKCYCKDGFEDKNCKTDIDECASNPCMNGGSCTDMVNGYGCYCKDGFEDKNCETDIDECASNPCMNEGSCTDMINGYNCHCKDGFEDKNCQTDIDECAPNPCMNGGSCTDMINGYNCSCKDGFEDKNCKTDIDECASNPCMNGGSCTDMINGYNCSCKDGFEDKNCETDIDACASNPCTNGGSCTDMINGYSCYCKDGFEEKNCERDIDECASNPCMNGGSCTDMINGYNCSCKDGFEDKNCQTDIDECASNPCMNGGSCTDMINGYKCYCKDGFEDKNCETDTDECASNPCMNGGSCNDMINGYNCSCKDGFEDKNCETDIDECASNPCINGGSCTDMINGYNCSCKDGFEEKNCETDTDDCVSAPCKNGGSCNDQVSGYSCSCQDGYDGQNCELAPVTKSRKKTKKIPFDRAQPNDLKLQKKFEYFEGKLELQTEKKRYLAAKTELVKQKTLYYMAMSAIAGKQSVLQLNIPDE